VRRRAWTALALALLPAVLMVAAAGPAGAAAAAGSQPRGGSLPVSIAITSITPDFLTPGKPVTVVGSVTNISGAPITGMKVRLRSAGTPFDNRDALQVYADSASVADSPVSGAVMPIPGTLAPHTTADWSIPLRAGQLGVTEFGVYPLAAEADSSAGTVSTRTFLPFWPRKRVLHPVRQDIAWIWPVISPPQQSACDWLLPGSLRTNSLAGSFGTGGRLSGLLAAGRAYTASAHLTWAIDPALLSSAQIMTRPYQFGGTAACTDLSERPASQAAKDWLSGLKSATTGQPVFVTPYADADVAALSHRGLNDELASAFQAGRATASTILRRNFIASPGVAASGDDSKQLTGLAWPAGGIANYGVLNSLAVNGIRTVVLGSATMPPSLSQNFTPSAVTTTPSGEGPRMHVLLADETITQVLGTADHGPAPAGTSFDVAQRFLAETAMIAAERPALARSVVVAPPRDWDPPPGLAGKLLASTVTAPWLRPVSLPRLAAAGPGQGQVHRQLRQVTSKDELRPALLAGVRRLSKSAALLQGIRVQQDPGLRNAIMAVESSAWRGGRARARRARHLLSRITTYVASQESSVVIIGPERVTLGGLSGTLPVSISNSLRYPVKVQLHVTVPGGGRITVTSPPQDVNVGAGADVTLKLHVRAVSVGSTTIQLSLLTPEGTPLPGKPIPLTVEATHFGTLALAIIGAALGVFVVTSIRRAFRHGRGEAPAPEGGGPDPGDSGGPESTGLTGRADNVVTDRADDKHQPEDPDEYASAPGRTDRR
jgi:Family of unknown function (DUF6049)